VLIEYQVHPTPKILVYNFWLNTTDYEDEKSIFAPAAYLMSQFPKLNKFGGLQGYYYVRPNAISAMFLAPNEFANATNLNLLMDPVLDKMKSMPGMSPTSLIKIPPIDFAALSANSVQSSSGGSNGGKASTPEKGMAGMNMKRHGPMEALKEPTAIYSGILDQDSILLGEEEITSPKLAAALEKSLRRGETGQMRGHLVGGNKVMSGGADTSVTPAWRRAYVHLMTTGNDKRYVDALRDLSKEVSPINGAYINEVRPPFSIPHLYT
jgi:hypothetical protein